MNTHATMDELLLLCNSEGNTSKTIKELLGNCVFCWGRLEAIKKDLRPAETELKESLDTAVEDD
jgi:hypothetical protein